VLDPVLHHLNPHHLHQAKQSAQFIAQLIQLDPELMLPAALPLLAARLMGVDGLDENGDADQDQSDLAVI